MMFLVASFLLPAGVMAICRPSNTASLTWKHDVKESMEYVIVGELATCHEVGGACRRIDAYPVNFKSIKRHFSLLVTLDINCPHPTGYWVEGGRSQESLVLEVTGTQASLSYRPCDIEHQVICGRSSMFQHGNHSQSELEAMLPNTTLERKSTGKYFRSRQSAPDKRPSSQVVGSFGIAMMAMTFGCIVLLDILNYGGAYIARVVCKQELV